mmetsp:Transcript_100557/g.288940  ORF Transcript_100557/g.288940 Transcript_100557/m.288940 type:complete len:89 (-) Transcript_100557:407-673(-)
MRNFLYPIQITSMIKSINRGRKTTVQTKYAIGNHCSHWEIIKGIGEVLPDIGVPVLSETFIVKPVHLRDLATFVVSPENSDPISVSDL